MGIWPLGEVPDDPQSLGSRLTYLRRYALQAMAGVAPVDDDGEAAQGRATQQTVADTQRSIPRPTPAKVPPAVQHPAGYLAWLDRLRKHAADLLDTDLPSLLIGDFNVIPTDLDVYKPERWRDDALFRPEVRDAYHRLLAQGWTDALRTMHPGERIYTFWDYFRNAYGRDAGLRIDHLLLSPSIAGQLKAAEVDRDVRGWQKSSDHAPTWIELDRRGWSA